MKRSTPTRTVGRGRDDAPAPDYDPLDIPDRHAMIPMQTRADSDFQL